MDTLLAVMLEARRLIALPDNDFSWSSFIDQEAALAEIDDCIARVGTASTNTRWMGDAVPPDRADSRRSA